MVRKKLMTNRERKEKYRTKDGRLGDPRKTFLGQTNKVRQLRSPRCYYYYYYYFFSPPLPRFSDLKTLWFSVFPLRVFVPARRKRNHCHRLSIFPRHPPSPSSLSVFHGRQILPKPNRLYPPENSDILTANCTFSEKILATFFVTYTRGKVRK